VLFRDRALGLAERLLRPISPRIAATRQPDAGHLHRGGAPRVGWRLVCSSPLTALYWTLTATALGILAHCFRFHGLTPLMLAVISPSRWWA